MHIGSRNTPNRAISKRPESLRIDESVRKKTTSPDDNMNQTCPFCTLPQHRRVLANEHAIYILDEFPISPGHSLIIPKRHVSSFFQINGSERDAMLALLDVAKVRLDDEHHPNGYNIGINDGQAAGQTVPHLHMHLIPRYVGDTPDPRGGVRWVLRDKADYWSTR